MKVDILLHVEETDEELRERVKDGINDNINHFARESLIKSLKDEALISQIIKNTNKCCANCKFRNTYKCVPYPSFKIDYNYTDNKLESIDFDLLCGKQ